MKRWTCMCGAGGRIPSGVDALEEGYRRLMEHRSRAHREEAS